MHIYNLLRITIAISEGMSDDDLNTFTNGIENDKNFLKNSKPMSQIVLEMKSQIDRAKTLY
jgi:hypothetical protein